MKLGSALVGAVALIGLTACSGGGFATRNAPLETLPGADDEALVGSYAAMLSASGLETVEPGEAVVTVTEINVDVPETLKVSEANRYFPRGDIVWREDPYGDRYEQVKTIVSDAMSKGVAEMDGPLEVALDIEVVKFHALTEKARYTIGGVHGLEFKMVIRDANTGDVLVPEREIRADLDAFGGKEAIQAEAIGQTQKVRITAHLADVIARELSDPAGYENPKLGLIQVINHL